MKKNNFVHLCKDESGQALSEYVIMSGALTVVFGIFVSSGFFQSEVFGNIYLFLKGLMISAALPIG